MKTMTLIRASDRAYFMGRRGDREYVAPVCQPVATTSVTEVVAPEPRMIDWRAGDVEPGVFLSNRRKDESGRERLLDPHKVVAVEGGTDPADGSPLVWFTLDNGWRLPFEPDFLVEAQCIPLPCPPWCVQDSFDKFDGTVRHGGAQETVTFTDETGKTREVYVVLSRWDDVDGTIAESTAVSVVVDESAGFDMTPAAAAELGRMIARLGVAGEEEPNLVDVEYIRLGDEVETSAGWQTVTLLVHDGQCREVGIYTVSEEEYAIRVPLGTLVNHRRNTGGSR
jgi:hypothetical protein